MRQLESLPQAGVKSQRFICLCNQLLQWQHRKGHGLQQLVLALHRTGHRLPPSADSLTIQFISILCACTFVTLSIHPWSCPMSWSRPASFADMISSCWRDRAKAASRSSIFRQGIPLRALRAPESFTHAPMPQPQFSLLHQSTMLSRSSLNARLSLKGTPIFRTSYAAAKAHASRTEAGSKAKAAQFQHATGF
jgi:hypothetical protein